MQALFIHALKIHVLTHTSAYGLVVYPHPGVNSNATLGNTTLVLGYAIHMTIYAMCVVSAFW